MSEMKAVFINQNGGPEVLEYSSVPVPAVGPNDVLVKVAYSSINFIDTYHRSGLYKLPFPAFIGRDAAGEVEAVGANVTYVKAGDRVALVAAGSNAEKVVVNVSKVVKIPEGIEYDAAVCCMLQGLTAQYLVRTSYAIKQGDTVLVHAGAGGTGGMLIQIAKSLGATVITTVSDERKAEIAKAHGADFVINYSTEDFVAKVKEYTDGKMCHAVYDGVGKSTWEGSMKSLRKLGTVVYFGNASGPVPPVDPLLLSQCGSIFMCRPVLFDHIVDHEAFLQRSNDVFTWVLEGKLKLPIAKVFELSDIQEAHKYLESRAATGKILLAVNHDLIEKK